MSGGTEAGRDRVGSIDLAPSMVVQVGGVGASTVIDPPLRSQRIAALDGWRAISIALVIAGHLISYRAGYSGHVVMLSGYFATFGVKVFFVISGFLITRLALTEQANTGAFSAGGFYLRRVFRILPAFFAYLLGVAVLAAFGAIDQGPVWRAAAFLCNLPGAQCGWYAGHTWSLAYEEQFYLLFPLIFLWASSARRTLFITIHVLLVCTPLVSFFVPGDWQALREFILHFSSLSAGVLAACFYPALRAVGDRGYTAAALLVVALSVLLVGANAANLPYAVRVAVEAVFLPPAIAWLILKTTWSNGVVTRALENRWVRYIGAISFSLYLWQEMFTGSPALRVASLWFNPLILLPVAAASYHFIELPMIRLGKRLSGLNHKRNTRVHAA